MAAAAYRSGERLWDATQRKWFEYENAVVHTEITAPPGTAEWVFNRQTLWNIVEHAEKQVNSQLAREVELTLPRELSRDQQIALVRAFVRDHFVSDGMVADWTIHEPLAIDGKPQPHAHVMLTMRRLDPTSPTGFAAKKERDWNEREDIARAVSKARRRFNDCETPENKAALEAIQAQRNVMVWRKAWEVYANRALEEAGSTARIDHRTLEAQGIKRPPQPSLGLARHFREVEKAYLYVKDRVTHWVAVRKRAQLYGELQSIRLRNTIQLTDFVLRLTDMAEDFAHQFQRPPPPIPEVSIER